MARERVYRNNAEKQAAYRARQHRQQLPSQRLLAQLARELHVGVRDAVAAGENRVPAAVLGKGADETMINLMRYVRGGFPEGDKEK
jgi:hypothetical protein